MTKSELSKRMYKYSVHEVLSMNLDLEYLTMLEWLITNIKSGRLNSVVGTDNKNYYIINMPAMLAEEPDLKFQHDAYLRKFKVLETKGLCKVQAGKWNDSNFGYSRTAVRLTKKYYTLLKNEE